jgi:hypothetical protein
MKFLFVSSFALFPICLPAPAADKPPEKWRTDQALTVSPQASPTPALRYRLFPLSTDRKDGNAVPIYLRLTKARNDAFRKAMEENTDKWNNLPPDQLPLKEVKEYLSGWKYNFGQIDYAAHRKTADWCYTVEIPHIIELLLPDIQDMRSIARVLALKARAEIAEKKFTDAIRTLEDGFSMSQQIGEAPFLIGGLVGVTVAQQFADALAELIEQPGAPNLYWALTAMPKPLVDLRRSMEFESQVAYMEFPELADLDRPRSPEQWADVLEHINHQMNRLAGLSKEGGKPEPAPPAPDPAKELATAKKYLMEVAGIPQAQLDAMPPAQILVLHMARYYRQLCDDIFKTSYLPYMQARPLLAEAEKCTKFAGDSEAARLVRAIMPAIGKVVLAQLRLEQKLAALRAVEALRLYAAAHDGQLPDQLTDVQAVPVPDDPLTGKPFAYHKDGQTATISTPVPQDLVAINGVRYRVTMRKR